MSNLKVEVTFRSDWERYWAGIAIPAKAWLEGWAKGYREGKAYQRRKKAARHMELYYRIERHGA